MRRGDRVVAGKELIERLGANDLCPCGSNRRFKNCCRNGGHYDGEPRSHYRRE